MKAFTETLNQGLVWLPELGIGHYPVPQDCRPYDDSYFSNYQSLADTVIGKKLTQARIDMIARHYTGSVVDVGIGSGIFVESRAHTTGYDVNPKGIEWLRQRDLWSDLYQHTYPALSFWDSLEHIDRPDIAVAQSQRWVFVSIPVFRNGEHVLRSKHFKPAEHIWYWSHEGVISWFLEQGFALAEYNDIESQHGREGIHSYAFVRIFQ
ncbi:methyltransferase domain-containing protein [Citrobacter youngae]|uniref:Methyltransferase domain protein n=1 Tax=Citrobacter youngae ATCC 29220 TaxID=500640 RepID=D4BBZ3_9ENTR|nr:methyltransferase domain-containing protein [Citrobacter youngae]EFE08611.1 hypothetical protein CIT292_07934 [Citrobacter youngae ATCC 29220]